MRLVAATVTLALTVSACGGESVDDYMASVAAATNQMARDAVSVLPPGAEPTHFQVSAVVAARRRALEEISRISPPDDFAPEHLALATALERMVAASEAFLTDTSSLDGTAFHDALVASTEIDALAVDVALACTAWERRASDLGHGVELGC